MGQPTTEVNFELTKNSPETIKTTTNLEKAYEELEKEILDIKNKLQKSLGASQCGLEEQNLGGSRPCQGKPGRMSMKSPGEQMEEHDYSLSVSDLGNSLYNSSGRGL